MEREQSAFGIEKIIKIFLDKWYIFTSLLIICIALCTTYIFFIAQENYIASTTIYVTEEVTDQKNENTELIVNEERAKDYKIIATSNRVLDKVREKFPLISVDPESVSVYEHPDTRILEISVKDADPNVAALLVNEITKVMIDEVKDIISKNNIKVIDYASTPTEPENIRISVYYILAVVLALFLSFIIVLFIEIFDNKVKGPDDCKERFDIPILGMIPKYNKAEKFNNE